VFGESLQEYLWSLLDVTEPVEEEVEVLQGLQDKMEEEVEEEQVGRYIIIFDPPH
jgi:hypothetical protein